MPSSTRGKCPSCQQVAAGTHPDLLAVDCRKATHPPDQTFVGEDDTRQRGLCHELSLADVRPATRAIIDAAEAMNDESANSMLKTLEEPPRLVLTLIATSADLLLPTICRCQILAFSCSPPPMCGN
jgi:DNA polymerase-3 subunit delta'